MILSFFLENFLSLSLLKTREFLFFAEKVLMISIGESKVAIAEKKEISTTEKKVEEKATFELFLVEKITEQSNKIKAIKTVRDILGIELRAAKDLLDKAPITIKKNLSRIEAEELLKKCEAIDAKFEIR